MLPGLDGQSAQARALSRQRDFRQPEIQNLCLSSIRHEDIRGLDVAMHDALRVRGVQSVRDLNAQIEQSLDLQRLARDPMAERLPLQQLHRDKAAPIGLVNLIDGADIRMVQRRRSLGLPLKPAEGLRVVGKFVGKKL